jgi:hypothetical protein
MAKKLFLMVILNFRRLKTSLRINVFQDYEGISNGSVKKCVNQYIFGSVPNIQI